MNHRHLTEDQMIVQGHDGLPPDAADCDVCRALHQSVARTLDEVATSVTRAADEAFPPERLARQRARILARVEHYGQRARVLAFPASRARGTGSRPRPLRRWVAAAAAAGLAIGLVAGRTMHDMPRLQALPWQAPMTSAPVLRASSDTLGDDELLRAVEDAVGSAGPNALRRIEDVTPVAWDVH